MVKRSLLVLLLDFLLQLSLCLSIHLLPLFILLLNVFLNRLAFLLRLFNGFFQILDTAFIIAALVIRLKGSSDVNLRLKSNGFILEAAQFLFGLGKLLNVL